jgi:hypothetical protein
MGTLNRLAHVIYLLGWGIVVAAFTASLILTFFHDYPHAVALMAGAVIIALILWGFRFVFAGSGEKLKRLGHVIFIFGWGIAAAAFAASLIMSAVFGDYPLGLALMASAVIIALILWAFRYVFWGRSH